MAMQVTVLRYDTDGDSAQQRRKVTQRQSYSLSVEQEISLTANVKTEVKIPVGMAIEHVYIEVDDAEVRVYKNLSPEYWTVEQCFMAYDTSISQLHLMATEAADVYVWLGGS